MRLVGYIRVSTEEQATGGESLTEQAEAIKQYCQLFDHELVEVVEDPGSTAKNLKRPGVQKCLAMLREGEADGLLVTKIDRLSRAVSQLSQLADDYFHDHILLSVKEQIDTSTASGKLHFNLLASMAQWEREVLSERTRDTMQSMIARGIRVGRAPYGLRYTEELDENGRKVVEFVDEEMRTIKTILHWKSLDPPMKDARIARMLNEQKVPTRTGAKWHRQTIANIVKRGMIEP